jgi:NADPH:quinone reductase-like Zn-dependent oxidoreductase
MVIDYTLQDFSRCPPVDLVIDAAGQPALLSRSLPLLKPWGTFVFLQTDLIRQTDQRGLVKGLYSGVTSLLWWQLSYAVSNRICYQWAFYLPNPLALNRMVEMAERDRLKPNVGKVYPFEQVDQAFRDLRDKEQRVGKVVLRVV